MGKVVIVGSQPIHNAKHDWSGVTCQGYSGEIDPENRPSHDEVDAQIAKFQMSGETTSEGPAEQAGVTASATAQASTRG